MADINTLRKAMDRLNKLPEGTTTYADALELLNKYKLGFGEDDIKIAVNTIGELESVLTQKDKGSEGSSDGLKKPVMGAEDVSTGQIRPNAPTAEGSVVGTSRRASFTGAALRPTETKAEMALADFSKG